MRGHARQLWVLVILTAISTPLWAQFGAGQYGNLVWDADKNCWVKAHRRGFARRLIENGGGTKTPSTFGHHGGKSHNSPIDTSGILPKGFQGAVVVTSDRPIAAIVNTNRSKGDKGGSVVVIRDLPQGRVPWIQPGEAEFDGELEPESELRSARRQKLTPAEFEPPAGYKRDDFLPDDVNPDTIDPDNINPADIDKLELGATLDPMKRLGLGASWHDRALSDPEFDGNPIPGSGPIMIQDAFLGRVSLETYQQEEQKAVTDGVTELGPLGERIDRSRQSLDEQWQQIKTTQQLFDALHKQTVGNVEKARDIAWGVVKGQAVAFLKTLAANTDGIEEAIGKMKDGRLKDSLTNMTRSDNWDAFVSGGRESALTGGILTYKVFSSGYLLTLGDEVLGELSPSLRNLVTQTRALYKVSQAASGLLTSTWNVQALEDLGETLGQNRVHFVNQLRELRTVREQQQFVAGAVVAHTESAVQGANGLDAARYINSVIGQLEAVGGDISDQIDQLRALRDGQVIMLPGGEWGTEPVLYERLWLVPNAVKRYGMLVEQRLEAKLGPGWRDSLGNRPPPGMVMLPLYPPLKDEPRIEPNTGDSTPAPKPNESGEGNNLVPLPDGSTASVPPGGAGPIIMSNGTRIYNYNSGAVKRFFVTHSGVTITHFRNGGIEVIGTDGTVTYKHPSGLTKVTLPSGVRVLKGPNGQTLTETDDGLVIKGEGQAPRFRSGRPLVTTSTLPLEDLPPITTSTNPQQDQPLVTTSTNTLQYQEEIFDHDLFGLTVADTPEEDNETSYPSGNTPPPMGDTAAWGDYLPPSNDNETPVTD
jgi:hypothetical protein